MLALSGCIVIQVKANIGPSRCLVECKRLARTLVRIFR